METLLRIARTTGLVGAAFAAGACGGHHGGADPTTTAIPAIAVDAVYVVNGGDSSITVLDAAADAVLGTIEITDADYPHHLGLSADGASLYLAVPGVDLSAGHGDGGGHDGGHGGFVLRMAAATGELVAFAALDAANHNAIPAPDGATVWTSQMAEPGAVLLLDPVTLELIAEIAVGAMPAEVTFAPDGSVGFVANGGDDSVTAIDVATREVVATIAVGDNPVGAWPGADGLMYVDNEAGQSLSVIDPATLAVSQTFELGFMPAYAAVAGGELWVTDPDAGRLVFLDQATGDVLGELATGAGAHAIALDPAGTRAWVTNQAADTVSIIDVATRAVVAELPTGAAPNGLVLRELP